MNTPGSSTVTAAATTEEREPEQPEKPSLLVVELAKRHDTEQIRRLRRGRGRLVRDIEEVLVELGEAGVLRPDAQPVVIVVRERAAALWPLDYLDEHDDDDDDDEDDEDDDDDDD